MRRFAYASDAVASVRFSEELRSERWVSKNLTVPRYLRRAVSLCSSCSSRVSVFRAVGVVLVVALDGACIAAAAACVTRTNASRPTSKALKRFTSWTGTGARSARAPLVSLDRKTLHECHDDAAGCLTNG